MQNSGCHHLDESLFFNFIFLHDRKSCWKNYSILYPLPGQVRGGKRSIFYNLRISHKIFFCIILLPPCSAEVKQLLEIIKLPSSHHA
jgi:hypothetical protein